jgi:hypothetical protein
MQCLWCRDGELYSNGIIDSIKFHIKSGTDLDEKFEIPRDQMKSCQDKVIKFVRSQKFIYITSRYGVDIYRKNNDMLNLVFELPYNTVYITYRPNISNERWKELKG